MKKFKTFEIEYLPETELKNPRCKISNNLDRQTVILPVSVDDNNVLDTAKKYLEAKTEICGYSETAKGYQIFTNWNFKLK
jgi:hypothetical protein